MNLIVNGSNQNQPISFGQILTYSIVYKNLGQKDLDDVSFTITLDSDILNFEEIEDKNFGIIDNNSITWGKDQISELDLVRPLDEGSIDFSIKVLDSTDVNLDTDNLQVKSKSQASLIKIGDLEIEELDISSNEILNNINTDIQLKVEGRYFNEDNIAVGTGPLPPVVGERTTFRIYWYIANSLHEVSDVVVSAVLPDGVEWVDKYLVKTGQISYSDKDNRVSWSINKISAGQDFQDINTWFDVAVIPTKQQEGKLLILSDQTFLVATDEQTESEISKSGKAVTSNLENDPVGGGRGLVIDITE
jgi:uncharacterized repeat protein (TIGR01451 family)